MGGSGFASEFLFLEKNIEFLPCSGKINYLSIDKNPHPIQE
jgi:hypothetical protein